MQRQLGLLPASCGQADALAAQIAPAVNSICYTDHGHLPTLQEEYAREGIDWSYVEFIDNQDCLDLLEGSANAPAMAVFPLIDEACRLPRATYQVRPRSQRAASGAAGWGWQHSPLSLRHIARLNTSHKPCRASADIARAP